MKSATKHLADSLLILLCLLALSQTTVHAEDAFAVEQVKIHAADGSFLMDLRMRYDFSAAVLEALDNGVPLTIVIQLQVRRTKAWLWEDSIVDQQLRYAIRYKPLSERYQVYRLPGTEGRSFVSRDAAIRALGEFDAVTLVAADALDADADYEVHIRAFLDIEELPLPLRPMAYLRPSWKLSSGWSRWPLQP